MRRRPFTAILHEVFRASLAAPIGLGCVTCGGHAETAADAGTGDSAIGPSDSAGVDSADSDRGGADADAANPTLDTPADGQTGPDAAACATPPLEAGVGVPDLDGGPGQSCVTYTLPVTGDPAQCGLHSSFNPCMYTPFTDTPLPFNTPMLCESVCHQVVTTCWLSASNVVSCEVGLCGGPSCCGRRPHGLKLEPASGEDRVGLWFAELAAREEASIAAFEIVADELEAHRAPDRLVAAAKRAVRDELRHARVMTAFAARYGGTPRRPRVERGPVRSLEEIAIENAAEGCVRETFGALVGMWQARFAGDPQVRKAMRGVARDESQHAAISLDVARWIEPMLDADARARLGRAKEDAMHQLENELSSEADPDVVRVAGIPSAHEARRLFEQARAMLWTGDEAERAG